MRCIATVTAPPEVTNLTTLERVKLELEIAGDANDALLAAKIAEASSDIEAHIGRVLSRATLSELFWGESGAEYLILARAPVAELVSVTEDDVAVDLDEVRLDPETGQLYRLDASGNACAWLWCKEVTVVYRAGYLLPGEDGRDLPAALEAGAIALLNSYWQSRGRDPTVRGEDVPGLGSVQYWVGAVGEAGELPPDVVAKISPFRRVLL